MDSLSLNKNNSMKQFIIFLVLLFCQGLYAQLFTKITNGPLATTNGDSRSVNWVDVNNDGFVDCMISNGPTGGQNNSLYLNNGAGNFTALAGDSIVLDSKPSDGATWADTDNDGDADCFVVNWYNANNLFYTNNGADNFTKINSGPPVNDLGYSETAAWGDYNNDGLVDVYVTNSAGIKRNFLYTNLGANTFTKVVTGTAVTDAFASRCVNWTDIDLDGDLDLFVTNENSQKENIYRNDRGGVFVKLTAGPLLNDAGNTNSGSWADFDNDGDLDVFLANDQGYNGLFRNDGNFNFVKLLSDTVCKDDARSFSSSWSDVDNDGDLDLFVTNSFGTPTKLTNFFYMNNGNSTFSRVSNAGMTADSAWSYGCAFADYDNDGFEDLAVATCRFNGIDDPDLLYHNNGNANHWLTIKLTGTISNHSAIGAKVRLKATISGNAVWQLREISSQNAYCSQNDVRAHFGLGDATAIDSIKIEWPSGIVQYSTALSPNQFIHIIESGSVTSVTDQKHKNRLSIFPNPANGIITVKMGASFSAGDRIMITDASGKQVAEFSIASSTKEYSIDTKKYNLAPGTYFITVFSANEKATRVITITH
jgi:hypothetical protein